MFSSARFKTLGGVYILFSAGGILVGCGASTENQTISSAVEKLESAVAASAKDFNDANQNSLALDPDNFTTEGKPKKTVETPWGPKEIYDYSNDPNVIYFYERVKLFRKEKKLNGIPQGFDDEQEKFWREYIVKARKTSELDLARIGCVEIITSSCNKIKIGIDRECTPKNNLGLYPPTACERENSYYEMEGKPFDFNRVYESSAKTCLRNGDLQYGVLATPQKLDEQSASEYVASSPDYICHAWQDTESWE